MAAETFFDEGNIKPYFKVKHVIIEDEIRPVTCSNFFFGLEYMEDIKGLNYLDISEVKDMSGFLCFCKSLKQIDIKQLNFSSVENIDKMLYSCSSVEEIDLSNLCTSHLKSAKAMAAECYKLKSISINNVEFSTCEGDEITEIEGIFHNDYALRRISVRNTNVFTARKIYSELKADTTFLNNGHCWKMDFTGPLASIFIKN